MKPAALPRRFPRGRTVADGPPARWTIWILAGGRSVRMGRDKARLSIGGRTLLRRVRERAAETGLPVRTIRRDVVPACGPLGGILTGLRRAGSGWCLFLTCDMPLITPTLLDEVRTRVGRLNRPVFLRTARGFGFPLALPVASAPDLERLITTGRLSVQEIAVELGASALRLPRERRREVANANTPSDLDALRRLLAGEKN